MWEELSIEKMLEQTLIEEFGEAQGKTYYGDYTATRARLFDVWDEIGRREPTLTDHGRDHIADVLGWTHQLMSNAQLSARELLALMLSILFHDTGNIYGREGHEKRVSEIYDYVRGTPLPPLKLEEKMIILTLVGAHSGEARDGSKDTIRDLNPTEPFLRRRIRMPEIAAILRFSDELAEGPQRTSEYLRRTRKFDITAEKFHDYASTTSVTIDKALGRIALTYNINICSENGRIDPAEWDRIQRLMEYAYYRIVKLDEERQYAKYYATSLNAFIRTSATLRFWLNDQRVDLSLEPLELDDLVVPGSGKKKIPAIDPNYEINSILEKLKSLEKLILSCATSH